MVSVLFYSILGKGWLGKCTTGKLSESHTHTNDVHEKSKTSSKLFVTLQRNARIVTIARIMNHRVNVDRIKKGPSLP